ncbi:FAD-dependent oxidoreductase [Amphibacillus sp. Q70]|uniref:FAD-dependent oxidoreductase n=1 Tax=Amphibacillus sp. Q70 TaxID=3453416 RepID=UPI003F877A42
MGLSNRNREETKRSLQGQTHDLLIIGGGLTGASIALDAVTRGINTVLLEMNDFGSGASARQSMLISEQDNYNYKTWKQLETEKKVIVDNFSALYQPVNGLHIKYKGDLDITGFSTVKKGLLYPFKRRAGYNASQLLRKRETLSLEPQLSPVKLEGGVLYDNGLIDRSAMTIELLKKANQLGTRMMNYLKVIRFIYDENNQIKGVETEDQITGEVTMIYSHRIINATSHSIEQMITLDSSAPKINFSSIINKKTQFLINEVTPPIEHVLSINDSKSGAFITAIPFRDQIMITSTEKVTKPIAFDQNVTEDKLKQLLAVFNRLILNQDLTVDHLSGVSVAYEIKYQPKSDLAEFALISKSGLISVLGTSMVSYRLYASKIVDAIAKTFKKELNIFYSESDTKLISINKRSQIPVEDLEQIEVPLAIEDDELKDIMNGYGDQAADLLSYFKQCDSYMSSYQIDRLLCAELLYCIENAAIYTPLDFFIRRSRLSYDQINLRNQLNGVLNLLADQLAWTKEERSYFEREMRIWLRNQSN